MAGSRIDTSLYFIRRGFYYASTAIMAFLSGFFLQGTLPPLNEWILVIIPVIIPIPFFISYSQLSRYGVKAEKNSYWYNSFWTALIFAFVVIFLLSALLIWQYKVENDVFPDLNLIYSFVVFAVLFWSYTVFLYLKVKDDSKYEVRHVLVWPVVLSISFYLYFGNYFFILSESFFQFLIPIGVVAGYFIFSEVFIKYKYQVNITGVIVFIVTLIIVVFNKEYFVNLGVYSYVMSLSFYIPLSAYLACFEAWRATHYVNLTVRDNYSVAEHSKDIQIDSSFGKKSPKLFYLATMFALTISATLIPFIFIFGNFGMIFIIGFFFHAIVAFSIWYYRYEDKLSEKEELFWIILKSIFGFLFLGILIVDSLQSYLPEGEIFPSIVNISGVGFLLVLVGFTVSFEFSKIKNEISGGSERISLKERFVRFIKLKNIYFPLVAIISVAMSFVIVALKDLYEVKEILIKANIAFIIYGVYVIICFVASGLKRLRDMIMVIVGFLSSARIITSLIIGLTVLLPSLLYGGGLFQSVLISLPFLFASMGGFAINDYFDIEKDIINKPHRALPRKMVSESQVLVFAIVLLISAVFSSIIASKTFFDLIIYFTTIAGVLTYNFIVRKFSLFKNVYTAFLCLLPLIYIYFSSEGYSYQYWILAALFMYITGREILMDIDDLPGDKLCGTVTIPMIIGEKSASHIGYILQVFGVLTLMPLIVYSSSFLQIILWSGLVFITFLTYWLWYILKNYRGTIINSMKISFLLGLLIAILK